MADAIIPRKRDFGFAEAGIPRYWMADYPLGTHMANALNLIFPMGERFFVRSVRHYMTEIESDPQLLERVAALPGVEAAGVSSHRPLGGGGMSRHFAVEGRPVPASLAHVPTVSARQESAGSLAALGVTVVRGRLFDEGDGAGRPRVAVINQTLARTLMTGITTLLALVSLYVLGPEVLAGFTFAMIWGVIIGTYSTIFIASPLMLYMGVKRDWSAPTEGIPGYVTWPDSSR